MANKGFSIFRVLKTNWFLAQTNSKRTQKSGLKGTLNAKTNWNSRVQGRWVAHTSPRFCRDVRAPLNSEQLGEGMRRCTSFAFEDALRICALAVGFSIVLCAPASARMMKDQTGRMVNLPENPHRLVSLAPNITEIVYALGLGDELVGDTDNCDYPPQATSKPHVGTMVNPSLERIVALKPDLALGTPEANRRETADQLERLGIPVYGVTASTLEGSLASIEDLGKVLGCEAEAKRLVARMQARIDRIENRFKGEPQPKVLFVVWYRPLITVGPHTFIADVIRAAGGVPIGENLKGEWPRLTLEELLPLNPDVILFPPSDSFSPSLEDFRGLPGWKDLRGVKEGRMYMVSETILRVGPRLVDALEELAGILHPVRK